MRDWNRSIIIGINPSGFYNVIEKSFILICFRQDLQDQQDKLQINILLIKARAKDFFNKNENLIDDTCSMVNYECQIINLMLDTGY